LCLFSMVVLCKHIANIMSYIAFPRNYIYIFIYSP
jgi:hypothetical protein